VQYIDDIEFPGLFRRFDGHVNNWPTAWTVVGGTSPYAPVTVTATDRFKRFGQLGELRSVLAEEILRESGVTFTSSAGNSLNGTFEQSIENWRALTGGTVSRSTDTSQGGSWSLKMVGSGAAAFLTANDDNSGADAKTVAPGELVSVGGWIRAASGAAVTPASHNNALGTATCADVAALSDVPGGVRQQQGLDVVGATGIDYNKIVGFFTDTDEYVQLTDGTLPTDKYSYIVTHWNIGPANLTAIKARHPNAKILAYQNLGGMIAGPHSNSRPTTLVTQEEAVTHGTGGDDWRLHKESDGTVVTFNDFSYLQAAHVGRASYRTQASSHFQGIKNDGFHGIMLDDTNMRPGHGFNEGDANDSTEFASNNAYRDAVTAAMAVLTPAARAVGLLMVPNVGMDPWDVDMYAGYTTMLTANTVDGVIREFWTNFSGGALFTGATWTDTMKVQTDAELNGKFVAVQSYPSSSPNDTTSIRYNTASFYLFWDGSKPSGVGYNDGRPLSAYPQYRKLIGTPTQAKQLVSGTATDGAWMRRYTGGIVCANAKSSAGTVTFTLGGTYFDTAGLPVTSVGLAQATGMVLLAQASPPVENVQTPIVQTEWAPIAGSFTSVEWTLRADVDPSPNGYFWAGQSLFAQTSPPTPVMMATKTADGTGTPHQEHLFYATNSGRWWLVYVDSASGTTLRLAWSVNLLVWTDAGSVTLGQNLDTGGAQSSGTGTNVAVAYRNIASTDVVHIGLSYRVAAADHRHYHLRLTVGATTFTVTNAEAQISTTETLSYDYSGDGGAVGFDSANSIYDLSGHYNGVLGQTAYAKSTNTDIGTSWTAGYSGAATVGGATTTTTKSRTLFDLSGGNLLAVYDNGIANVNQTALNWSKYTGTWSANASAGFGAATFNFNDWGACLRTTTDAHVVLRTGTNTYEHRRFNGTSWAAGNSITTQNSKAGAGLFLTTDGTDVYLFIIDSDGANTVRYSQWSSAGSSWGAWTAFETSTQTRTALSGYRVKGGDGNIAVAWTESASPFRVVTKPFITSDSSGDVWYAGLQSGGTIPSPPFSGKIAIFSVWGARAAAISSIPGAYAAPFSSEGTGYTVRIPYAWQIGTTYRIRVEQDVGRGAGWWICSVTNLTTGVGSWVGSIQASVTAGNILGSMIQFTEYFSNPGTFTTCNQIPGSDVTFGTPIFASGATGATRQWRPVLRWLDSSDALLASTTGTLVTDAAGTWTQYRLEGVTVPSSPSGITQVCAGFETTTTPANSETHYLDTVQLVKDSTLSGGTAITTGGTVSAYYPLSEPERSTSVGSITRYPQGPAIVKQAGSGGEVEFAQGIGPGTDETSAPIFTPATTTDGKYLEAKLLTPITGTGMTLEAWMRTANTSIFSRELTALRNATGNTMTLGVDAEGDLVATGWRGLSQAYTLSFNGAAASDARTHHVAVTEALSNGVVTVRLYLDGLERASTSFSTNALPTYSFLTIGGRPGTGMWNGTVAHVAATGAALPVTRISEHHRSGIDGLAGERTDQRIARIADWIGIPSTDRSLDVGLSTVGWQGTDGQQPISAMQECEATEAGVLFMAGDGDLTFHGRARRYNTSVSFTLDAASNAHINRDAEFPGDDFGLFNDATISRQRSSTMRAVNQASIDEFGLYRADISIISDSDDETMSAAQWIVNNYGTPLDRIPNITVDLLALATANPALVNTILASDISAKVRLTNLPVEAPATSLDMFLEGSVETIDNATWQIVLNCSPSVIFNVWQLGTAGFSELGTTTRLAR
jgi:hypothetical protein